MQNGFVELFLLLLTIKWKKSSIKVTPSSKNAGVSTSNKSRILGFLCFRVCKINKNCKCCNWNVSVFSKYCDFEKPYCLQKWYVKLAKKVCRKLRKIYDNSWNEQQQTSIQIFFLFIYFCSQLYCYCLNTSWSLNHKLFVCVFYYSYSIIIYTQIVKTTIECVFIEHVRFSTRVPWGKW